MKKYLMLLLALAVLTGAASAALDNELTLSIDTDYYMENANLEGYDANTLCHLSGDITLSYHADACFYAIPGLQYRASGTLYSVCNGKNILVTRNNTDNNYLFFFVGDSENDLLNASISGNWVMQMDTLTHDSSGGGTVSCSIDGKSCNYVIPTSGEYQYVCINDTTYNQTVDQTLNLILPMGIYNNNYELKDVFTNNQIVQGGVEARTMSVPGDYDGFFHVRTVYPFNDVSVDLNFTEAFNAVLATKTKNIIVNITYEPEGLDLSEGQMGLWDCDTGGYSDLYLSLENLELPISDAAYAAIINNCINLMDTTSDESHYPITGSAANMVDANGDTTFSKTVTCGTPTFTPQLIYKYNQGSYLNHYVYPVDVDFFRDDEDLTFNLLWSYDFNQDYDACFNFIDGLNYSSVTVSKGHISYSYDPPNFPNNYNLITIDDTALTLTTSDEVSYKVFFEAEDAVYSNSAFIDGKFSLNPMCHPVYFFRNVSALDTKYNVTVRALSRETQEVLEGIRITIDCLESDISKSFISSSDGEYITDILDQSWCKLTANANGCIGLDNNQLEFYVIEGRTDYNFSISCDESFYSGGNIIETNSSYVDISFFVHSSGSNIGLASIPIIITGDKTRKIISDSEGYAYIYDVPKSGQYTIKVDIEDYDEFVKEWNGFNPFDISLIPHFKVSTIDVKVKYNGSLIGGADVVVKQDGDTIFTGETGATSMDLGIYGFNCVSGSKYSVYASYNGKEGFIENIVCPDGEGKTFNLDISKGENLIISETEDDIVDFTAFMWIIVKILIVIFSILVAKRLSNEIFK